MEVIVDILEVFEVEEGKVATFEKGIGTAVAAAVEVEFVIIGIVEE